MREVDDAHEAEDEREPAREQEQQSPEAQPVERLEEQGLGRDRNASLVGSSGPLSVVSLHTASRHATGGGASMKRGTDSRAAELEEDSTSVTTRSPAHGFEHEHVVTAPLPPQSGSVASLLRDPSD